MLDTHPQKSKLTVVLVPLATEVLSLYGNIPIPLSQKKVEFEKHMVRDHGFRAIDYSLLDDGLYYIKQLEIVSEAKDRLLSNIS